MKKIEAYIRPEKLDAVIDALERGGFPGVSVTESKGLGKQRGEAKEWHGQMQPRVYRPKIRLDIVAHDKDANRIANTIAEAGQTQEYGDGKIFILPVEDAIRIRTRQRGEIALD